MHNLGLQTRGIRGRVLVGLKFNRGLREMEQDIRKEEEQILETVIDRDLREIAADEAQIKRDKGEVKNLRHELAELREEKRVEVVIDGTPYKLDYESETTVKTLIIEALKKSGNQGRPVGDWQIKYEGKVLDENAKVASYHLPCDAVLFLSLRAGNLG